jgi:hypothetical protein
MNKQESIYQTALLLVDHFDYCNQREDKGIHKGIHTRIFSHILHPEEEFVAIGRSKEVANGAESHPEHIVPCATLITESCRLLREGVPKQEIAQLLVMHWKIVYISKEQAKFLDTKSGLNLKNSMPAGWDFKTSDSFARLNLANIKVLPLEASP